MTTQASTKVRLVRCPGCRVVLAELPDVPVYKCGGCGTVLQAKNHKLKTSNTELISPEPDSVAKIHQDNVLGPQEARSTNQVEKDNSIELSQGGSASDSSPDITSHRAEDSSTKVKESPQYNQLRQDPEVYQSKVDEARSVSPTFSDELPSSGEITLEDANEHVEQQNRTDLHQDDRVYQKEDPVQNSPDHENQESVLPGRIKDNYVPPENDEKNQTCSADLNEEFDRGIEHNGLAHGNDSTSPSTDQADDGSEGLRRNSRREKNVSLVSFYLTSDDEHLDHPQSAVPRDFERISSIDTLESSHLAGYSSEHNFRHGSVSNNPINGSYYYDGSESSYDGTDDQTFKHTSHPPRKNNMLREDGFNVVRSEPERAYIATGSSHHATRRSQWSRSSTTEANRYHSGRRMRVEKQEDVSGLPFTSREPVTGHRSTGYRHSLLPPRPGVNLPNKPMYSEPDNVDLLRTVYELKDKLNRMHSAPFQYNHLPPNRDIYAAPTDLNGYNPQHYQYNVSRAAFSGEATHYRHHVSCSCLHCCPHYSAQLPSRNCCNISTSPSPQDYPSSEHSLWGFETKPGNQRLDERQRLRLREKHHATKKHLRPVAGGAPIVACYHCWELLQLPADFLLFKRRYHRLMCNACKKVLKFSVLRGTHIVPYVNDASAPPPSEADDFNDGAARQRYLEPVSYSDDHGPSFCRSSTEGEASVALPPSDRVETKSYNRKIPVEDRKMKGIMKEPQSESEGSPNFVEQVGPSSKMPTWRKVRSDIKEVQSSSNSPLHRLMGYSSARHVLNK